MQITPKSRRSQSPSYRVMVSYANYWNGERSICSLNPLPIGSWFPTSLGRRTAETVNLVSIPFLSGHGFLHPLRDFVHEFYESLNPLPIGSWFPTQEPT